MLGMSFFNCKIIAKDFVYIVCVFNLLTVSSHLHLPSEWWAGTHLMKENLRTLIRLWCPSGTEREAMDKVNGPRGVRVSRVWQIIGSDRLKNNQR